MRRYHLSKKKIKEIKRNLAMDLDVNGNFEILEDEVTVVLIDGVPSLFEFEGRYFPTVLFLLNAEYERNYVTVDMGAVKHVLNGANVFAAGVVDADEKIKEGDAVFVRDEKYRKPLAVGIAMMNSADMISSKNGIAVRSLHHYGDKIISHS